MEERLRKAGMLLEKAERHLLAAKVLRRERLYGDALSRAYYAVFSAAAAVLTLLGYDPKTHGGLKELFGIHVVSRGLMDREKGKILRRLFELRQEGDYEAVSFYDEEEVNEAIEDAEGFLKDAKEAIKRLRSSITG